MDGIYELSEDYDRSRFGAFTALIPEPATMKAEDLAENAVDKTKRVLLSNIGSHQPYLASSYFSEKQATREIPDAMLGTQAKIAKVLGMPSVSNEETIVNRPTLPEVAEHLRTIETSLEGMKASLESENPPAPHALRFPHLAWEAVKAGLAYESYANSKLRQEIEKMDNHQKDMDLLLDLNIQLASHKDEAKEMSPEMKRILNDLKARGIDLWKDSTPVKKETIGELKILSTTKIDELKAAVHRALMVKIQPMTDSIRNILEIVKQMMQSNERLIRKANEKVQ